jgi:CheY-like chemotaxis protein
VGRSILLVEDDVAIVDALSEALADEGYQVTVAGDGRRALDMLHTRPAPDVILVDLTMPVMDGFEFRQQQLTDPELAAIPTFVLTAGAVDDRMKAMQASGWLRKPVPLDALLMLLERQCGGGESKPQDHHVHFYSDEEALTRHVSGFLAQGLQEGESALAIVEQSHMPGLRAALAEARLDTDELERGGRLLLLGAKETLSKLKVRGLADPTRFASFVGSTIDLLGSAAPRGRVRAYGEMVDLLWQAGDVAGALHLESLWNHLGRVKRFSLLCGYLAGREQPDPRSHTEVLRQHSTVV